MKYKIIIGIFFLLAIVGIFGGYATFQPEGITVCEDTYTWNCYVNYGKDFGNPIYLFSLFLAPIFLFLLFFRKEVFYAWLKFGAWFIPLAAFLIALAPTTLEDLLIPTKRTATILLGQLFLAISLLIIAWKSWRLRRSGSQK